MVNALIIICAYLLGSIPSGLWIGKAFYKTDIREHGSGNLGATNTFRTLGKKAGAIVTIIDILKGTAAVLLPFIPYFQDTSVHPLILGAIAVLGHMYPIFAGFRGGKGVATLLGAGTAIFPPILLMCFGFWCLVFAVSHYVSLASMVAGCCYPVLVMIFSIMPTNPSSALESIPFIVFSWIVAILLIWTHRKNIGRLRDGTESKIYLWLKPAEQDNVKGEAKGGNSKTLGELFYDEYSFAREDVSNQK